VARRRLTRKEIKQPDRFLSFARQSIEWAKAHATYLLYGVVGLLVVAGLIVGWATWQRHREQQAERMLYRAVKVLTSTEKSADGTPENAQQRRAEAQRQLQALTRDYPGTRAAYWAFWHLGHLYFEAGKYQAALEAYEHARDRLGDGQLMSMLVTLNISSTYEALGACDKAVAGFEEVVRSSLDWLHSEAYQGMGRCYEAMGALDKALATYEQALADPALSGAVRQQIEAQRTRLQARAEAGDTQTSPPSAESSSTASP
jgi:tetratricopeptide (TPR) repeat protein